MFRSAAAVCRVASVPLRRRVAFASYHAVRRTSTTAAALSRINGVPRPSVQPQTVIPEDSTNEQTVLDEDIDHSPEDDFLHALGAHANMLHEQPEPKTDREKLETIAATTNVIDVFLQTHMTKPEESAADSVEEDFEQPGLEYMEELSGGAVLPFSHVFRTRQILTSLFASSISLLRGIEPNSPVYNLDLQWQEEAGMDAPITLKDITDRMLQIGETVDDVWEYLQIQALRYRLLNPEILQEVGLEPVEVVPDNQYTEEELEKLQEEDGREIMTQSQSSEFLEETKPLADPESILDVWTPLIDEMFTCNMYLDVFLTAALNPPTPPAFSLEEAAQGRAQLREAILMLFETEKAQMDEMMAATNEKFDGDGERVNGEELKDAGVVGNEQPNLNASPSDAADSTNQKV
ncbi:hypothetical protein DL96DRAFT_1819302 [Flagelloscypha sp. PMI_526]|nr:hypothetical protein DL96DRAFT_1819302 [Flagelloscypha sp. PMI_526]